MKLGRSVVGALAGVLLGLGVIVLAAAGGVPAAAPAAASPAKGVSNSTAALTMATTSSIAPRNPVGGIYSAFGFANPSGVPSQLSSISKQPVPLTLFTLLPVLGAIVLGFALYRLSMRRVTEDELPGPD